MSHCLNSKYPRGPANTLTTTAYLNIFIVNYIFELCNFLTLYDTIENAKNNTIYQNLIITIQPKFLPKNSKPILNFILF